MVFKSRRGPKVIFIDDYDDTDDGPYWLVRSDKYRFVNAASAISPEVAEDRVRALDDMQDEIMLAGVVTEDMCKAFMYPEYLEEMRPKLTFER